MTEIFFISLDKSSFRYPTPSKSSFICLLIGAVSPETRALMEQILASGENQEEIQSRVAALLAGTALTTSKGVAKGEGREVELLQYEGGQ